MEENKKSKFYVIKLINMSGTRGYVIDHPKDIMISIDGVVANMAQFQTYQDAQQFIRDKKLERRATKAYIRDNEDLMRDKDLIGKGMSVLKNDVFYIENEKGEKVFYDAKKEQYYFKMGDVGYPCWYNMKQINAFIDAMDFQEKIIVKKLAHKV